MHRFGGGQYDITSVFENLLIFVNPNMSYGFDQLTAIKSSTVESIRNIELASKDPDKEEDIDHLVLLVSELDTAFQKEIMREFPVEGIPDIIRLMNSLWMIVEKYFELRTRTQIRRSVTTGLVLRYKIVRFLANIQNILIHRGLKSVQIPSDVPIVRSLIDFVRTKLDKSEKKSQSFSHLVVRVLGLWKQRHDTIVCFQTIADGIKHREIHESYSNELPFGFMIN